MTQAELARAIGVSPQAVFAYELGDRRISVLVLGKLSRVFKIPVEDLMGMTKPARASKGRLSPRAMRHAEPSRTKGLVETIRARVESFGGVELEIAQRETMRGPIDFDK